MSTIIPAMTGRWNNRYLLMRHGHSLANQQGVIISSPARGLTDYGLSRQGRQQLESLLATWQWAAPDRILHSDFRRTRETAERIAHHFGLGLEAEPRLRERHFGELEGEKDDRYADVWRHDAQDAHHRHAGVEALATVAARMGEVVADLERDYAGKTILLVSHGDPLQILLTALEGRELCRHRERVSLTPASITPLSPAEWDGD
ncbi:histidine phosphatase family protein [Halomonas sp.]|uniref:histidine phosphatase family protein n=1 Tax=Halomonas sp. TaxID=1486246 RepID=UPI002357DFCB|nr:histidine phosphatase family protein [Halomonas sp.]